MLVEYYAHSCFAFTDARGRRLMIDPYGPEVGYALPLRPADVTLVSHAHFDHDHLPAVRGRTTVVRGAVSQRVCGLEIRGVLADHGGRGRGHVVLFRWEMDGVAVAHLSDLGTSLTEEQVRALGHVDLLLVPCGGAGWTLGPRDAQAVVEQLRPRWAVPMHYGTPFVNREVMGRLEPVSAFLDAAGRFTRAEGSALRLDPAQGDAEILLVPHMF